MDELEALVALGWPLADDAATEAGARSRDRLRRLQRVAPQILVAGHGLL